MNKTELTQLLAKKTGLTGADAKRAINAIFSTAPREGIIASEVSKGKKVQITGFGTFESRKRKKRQGRNPQTGESIIIPGGKYPAFVAGKSLKESASLDQAGTGSGRGGLLVAPLDMSEGVGPGCETACCD